MESALWGLVGTVVGAAASILTTTLTAWNAARLHRETHSTERLERSRAFQRETLLELQDTIQIAMRFVGQVFHAGAMDFKRTGKWGSEPISDEIDEGLRRANMRLTALIERVADDSLRAACRDVHSKMNLHRPRGERDAAAMFTDAVRASHEIMRQLGEALRKLY
jgi:hypothetical protein